MPEDADKANETISGAKEGVKDNVDQISAKAEHLVHQTEEGAEDMLRYVKNSAINAQAAFDDSLDSASQAVKRGTAEARFQYSRAFHRAQEFVDTGVAHSQAGLDMLFDKLKEGVDVAREHPNTSYACGIATALIALPGTRRFLWGRTIGRFRSEEGMFRSAELKASHLKQSIEGHAAESKKLLDRLAVAQEQYSTGLAKVKATNSQLQSLLTQVGKSEKAAAALIDDLRELPSSQALKLRADVAMQYAAAKAQSSALDRQVYNLSKKGF